MIKRVWQCLQKPVIDVEHGVFWSGFFWPLGLFVFILLCGGLVVFVATPLISTVWGGYQLLKMVWLIEHGALEPTASVEDREDAAFAIGTVAGTASTLALFFCLMMLIRVGV